MVPVNLRGEAGGPVQLTDASLGNKFGLVPLLLPIGIGDPLARVQEVQRRMNALKGGYTAVLAMAVLGLAGLAPRLVQRQALDLLARKATAVMTNVPGPRRTLYLAGSRLRQLMFWVPQSGDIGVGVSILSYDGLVQFGLITDKALCGEPQAVIDLFIPQFELLRKALSEPVPAMQPKEPQRHEEPVSVGVKARPRRTRRKIATELQQQHQDIGGPAIPQKERADVGEVAPSTRPDTAQSPKQVSRKKGRKAALSPGRDLH
jgi:WS/DGAT C-terminal domain